MKLDAVVVGAGPAGAAAALVLARGGARIAWLDRARFPREKVCGDALAPDAVRELLRLGIDPVRIKGAARPVVRAVGLAGPGRAWAEIAFELPDFGLVVPRVELDAALVACAAEAGAELRAGVRCLPAGPSAVQAGAELLRADVVIAADGATSAFARAARLRPGLRLWSTVRAYYEDVAGPDDRVDFVFEAGVLPGYVWVFPTGGGGANVGALLPGATGMSSLRDAIERASRAHPALRRRLATARQRTPLKGWPIPVARPGARVTAERLLLVGDAAAGADAATAEGIGPALRSGREAALAVLSGADPVRVARRSRRALDRAALASFAGRWLLSSPARVEALIRVLAARPAAAAAFVGASVPEARAALLGPVPVARALLALAGGH